MIHSPSTLSTLCDPQYAQCHLCFNWAQIRLWQLWPLQCSWCEGDLCRPGADRSRRSEVDPRASLDSVKEWLGVLLQKNWGAVEGLELSEFSWLDIRLLHGAMAVGRFPWLLPGYWNSNITRGWHLPWFCPSAPDVPIQHSNLPSVPKNRWEICFHLTSL